MKNLLKRPSTLTAACAPVSVTISDAPQLPRVHQVRAQAELALTAVRVDGSYGTNGFTGMGAKASKQRLIGGARGVPPRGRPV